MKVYIVLWDVPYEGATIQEVFAGEGRATMRAQDMNLRDHGTPGPNPRGEGAYVETWEVK